MPAHIFEYLLSCTSHNKAFHRNPNKISKRKLDDFGEIMTYLCSFFEGRVVDIQRIKLITLPAGLLAGSSHLPIWLGTAFLPCWDRAQVEVFCAVVQISKEAALFSFVVLQCPWFFHFLEFDLFVWFRWSRFSIRLFATRTSPGIQCLKEWVVALRFVILAILQLFDSDVRVFLHFLECWDHADLLLFLLLGSLLPF